MRLWSRTALGAVLTAAAVTVGIATPAVAYTDNTPPTEPTGLRVGSHDCGAADIVFSPGYSSGVPLAGAASDPDGNYLLKARVQVWDVADPSNVHEVVPDVYSSTFSVTYPDSLAADGATYQWRARSEDREGGVSTWSPPCEFTIDRTRPAVPPTIESDYFVENSGPPGVTGPGEFTFTANGIADVVGFAWEGIGVPYGEVQADQPGGSATVTIMPERDGPLSISVRSYDAAGNPSDSRTYRFWVASNAPTTTFQHFHYFGERVPVTLTALQPDATTFTYTWEDEPGQPEHTLPVGADGTASLVIDMPKSGGTQYDFTVWTTTAAGQRSQVTTEIVEINNMEPWVDLSAWEVPAGTTITAVIDPVFLGDVQAYHWRIDDGPESTVIPNADDSAQFTYTPTEPGRYTLHVYATYPNGGVSGVRWLRLTVT